MNKLDFATSLGAAWQAKQGVTHYARLRNISARLLLKDKSPGEYKANRDLDPVHETTTMHPKDVSKSIRQNNTNYI